MEPEELDKCLVVTGVKVKNLHQSKHVAAACESCKININGWKNVSSCFLIASFYFCPPSSLGFSLYIIHNRGCPGLGAAAPPALLCSARNKVMQHLTPLMVRSNCHNTHLHSPDNSLRLRTGTRCETVAAAAAAGRRSEGKGMDRSTGRVVVPFSGCAAPSLHPCWWCRVGERSLAIEGRGEREKTRRKERKGERERERERRRRRGKEGPQLAKSLSIRSAACCLRSLEDTLVYAAKKKVKVIKSSFKV